MQKRYLNAIYSVPITRVPDYARRGQGGPAYPRILRSPGLHSPCAGYTCPVQYRGAHPADFDNMSFMEEIVPRWGSVPKKSPGDATRPLANSTPALFRQPLEEIDMKAKLLLCSLLVLLAACASAPDRAPSAVAQLEARSGSQVKGTVSFYRAGDKVVLEASVSGLTPGEHGFHVHEVGDCSAPDATSAKGHFNPGAKQHGPSHGDNHHAGDMPNLVADASGNAKYRAELSGLTLSEGAQGVFKRSVVIHADPDDYKSQPAGNSGKRVACGVILAR